MHALIDGDILVYRAAFAAERTHYSCYAIDPEEGRPEPRPFWDDYDYHAMRAHAKEHGYEDYEVVKRKEVDPEHIAIHNVNEMMKRIVLSLEDVFQESLETFIALSTGTETFRHKAFPNYKASRKEMPKPVHYDAVRDHLMKEWGAVEFKSIEADDALAIAQELGEDRTVICSIDKDLLQVPGKHYHIVEGINRIMPDQKAYLHLWKQVMTGDRTDDIPGIFRLGDAKAHKILSTVPPDEYFEAAWARWEDYSKTDRYKEEWGDTDPHDAMLTVYELVRVGGKVAKEALANAPEEEQRQVPFWTREGSVRKAG